MALRIPTLAIGLLSALCLPAAPVLRYELAAGRQDRALWLFEPFVQLGPRVRLDL